MKRPPPVVGKSTRPPKWIKPQLMRLVDEARDAARRCATDAPTIWPTLCEAWQSACWTPLIERSLRQKRRQPRLSRT